MTIRILEGDCRDVHRSRVQHLVNVSGGKDSTACYTLAVESAGPSVQ